MARGRVILPRSLLPLLLLLAAAGGWLLLDGRRGAGPGGDAADGGPGGDGLALVPFPPDDLVRLEVERADGPIVLARDEAGHWRFAAGCDDRADDAGVAELVASVTGTAAAPLLPEAPSADEAAQFGLRGPEAVVLRLAARDGRTVACTVGRRNPVRGACYAVIDGRPGTWTVPYPLRVRLLSLPDIARLRRLWPPFAVADAETVAWRPAGAATEDLFARDADGAWWLRAPADGDTRAGALFPAYARLYGDRVARRAGVDWWRAQDRVLDDLLFQLGQTDVKLFGPRAAPAETLRAAGLLPAPLVLRVVLRGGESLRLALGGPGEEDNRYALRDGRPNLLQVGGALGRAVAAPLADRLRLDALPLALAGADSFALALAGRPTLRAWRRDGGWSTSLPALADGGPRPADLVADLATNLDRLPIVRPLPPAPAGRDPLAAAGSFALTVWHGGRPAPALEARFGRAAGGGDPSAPEAELWVPATGQRLAVPAEILISLRSLFLSAR